MRVSDMRILIGLAFCLWASGTAAQSCGEASSPCQIDSGTYHIKLPEAGASAGAVIHLHGGGGRGKSLLKGGMAREALRRGYAFIAPNGEHPTARFPRNWAVRAKNFEHEKDDIAFLRDVLADAATRHGVDTRSVLLSGFSRGGSMVWDVACFAPDFATVYAPAAGAFWDELPEKCQAPVTLLHTHGWSDRTVPLEGRPLWKGSVAQGDVWASLKIMRETNGCDARQPERNSVIGEQLWRHWSDCNAGRIDLMLHPGGHGAPKGWAVTVLDWFEARLSER